MSCPGKRKKKKEGGVPLVLYTINPLTFPGAFQCCLVKNLLFPCSSSWSSGGGSCCTDNQMFVSEWRYPTPCQVARIHVKLFALRRLCSLEASLLPGERRGKTGGGQISSPRAKSSSYVPNHSLPVYTGLDVPGGILGGNDLYKWKGASHRRTLLS